MARIVFKTKDGSLIMNRIMNQDVYSSMFGRTSVYKEHEKIRHLNYDAREKGVKIIQYSVNYENDTINVVVDYL